MYYKEKRMDRKIEKMYYNAKYIYKVLKFYIS